MATVKMAGNAAVGNYVQGNYGTYQQGTDGTFTVDTRDAAAMLAAGMTYLTNAGAWYTTPIAPAAASSGRVFASAALSSGAVAIANQPDIMRQVVAVVGAGTVAITSGSLVVTYVGNDQISHTDTLSLACAANGTSTVSFSRGVVSIATMTVPSFAGGASPFLHIDTTANLAAPADPNAQDFVLNQEFDASTKATAPGSFLSTSIGCFSTQGAPNATLTYSIAYTYVSPGT